MSEYGIREAKAKLPDLIKQMQLGEQITITRRGQSVADLIPSSNGTEQQTRAAITAIKALRTGTINQETFKQMRQQGRR